MKKLPAALSTNIYTLLLTLTFVFVGLTAISPAYAVDDAEAETEKVSVEDPENFETPPRANYYDVPDNYNMDSCEKIVANNDHVDVIEDQIPVQNCVNGKSSGNSALNCTKNWQVAYAEVVAVKNFPLLNFFSATQPTDANGMMPPCMRDISRNVSNAFNSYIPVNYSNDYAGLLAFGGTKTADISYPRLGTASACAGVDSRDVWGPLLLDIQGFNTQLPQVVSQNTTNAVANSGDDNIWAQLISAIKNLNPFKETLKSKANEQIKTIESEMKKIGYNDKKQVCSSVPGKPITKINISDPITPTPALDTFVTNKSEEIKQYDHTELCDLQYLSGKVIDAGCEMTSGEVFDEAAGTSLVSGGYPGAVRTFTGYEGVIPQYDCKYPNICGAEFDCGASYASAYGQCRSSATVANAWGLPQPKYLLNEKGFDKLTIPNGNVLISSSVNNSEQINAPYAIRYGENIGIRLDVERQIYDLNRFQTFSGATLTGSQPYNPDTRKAKDYDPNTVNSDFSRAISYKLTQYNYVFNQEYKDNFKAIASEPVKTQYYFPYLGKLPQMIERMALIFSNSTDPETACTISGNCDQKILGTSTDNVNGPAVQGIFDWSDDIPESVIDPQLKFCSELTPEEQKVNDCYVSKGDARMDDPVKEYLCEYNLEQNCGNYQCIDLTDDSEDNDSDGGTEDVDTGPTDLDELVSPVNSIRITYPYAADGYNYGGAMGAFHMGIDFGGKQDIFSAGKGVVIEAGFVPGWSVDRAGNPALGNLVTIEHTLKDGKKVVTRYAHLESVAVTKGQEVDYTTKIGVMGYSGNVVPPGPGGTHLHFELKPAGCNAWIRSCYMDPTAIANRPRPSSNGVLGDSTEGEYEFIQSPNYLSVAARDIKGIVYHHMGGGFEPSKNWFLNPTAKASSHYLVRKDGFILQMVKDQDIAWHAGLYFNGDQAVPPKAAQLMIDNHFIDPNSYTIGIEIEGAGEPFTDEQYTALCKLTTELTSKYNIPIDRYNLIGHYEIHTQKVDPTELDWDRLLECAKSGESGSEMNYCENGSGSVNDWGEVTLAGVYGNLNGWGHLRTSKGDPAVAIQLAETFTVKVDELNGPKRAIPLLIVNAVMATKEQSPSYMTSTYQNNVLDLIQMAKTKGYYVMIDVQTGNEKPLEVFKKAMDLYLIEDNVFFDGDLEWMQDMTTQDITEIMTEFDSRRKEKGFTSPAIFGAFIFSSSLNNITDNNPIPDVGTVSFVPINDGIDRGSASCAVKNALTKAIINKFSIQDNKYGFLYFIPEDTGAVSDACSMDSLVNPFPDQLIYGLN